MVGENKPQSHIYRSPHGFQDNIILIMILSVYSSTLDVSHLFFPQDHTFISDHSMHDIPALRLNAVHLLFEGLWLPRFKIQNS